MSACFDPQTLVSRRQWLAIGDSLRIEQFYSAGEDDEWGNEHLARQLLLARYKIINVLRRPVEQMVDGPKRNNPRRRKRYSENSASMAGNSKDDLARYIAQNTKRWGMLGRTDWMLMAFSDAERTTRKLVQARARYLLVRQALDQVDDASLWYDDGNQAWQAAQSLVDELRPLQCKLFPGHNRPGKPRVKLDQRSHHGGSNSARKRKARPPGMSVGGV